jgi:alkaline phosphatase D
MGCIFETQLSFMRYSTFVSLMFFCFSGFLQINAQVISGPMIGHTELRSSKIWIELQPNVKGVKLNYQETGNPLNKGIGYQTISTNPYTNTVVFEMNDLKPGTSYNYQITTNDNKPLAKGSLKTQQLWQWRSAPPDFSFLAGSCAYFNEPPYDRPGRPYGGDSTIFTTMAKEKADFMLWLGDNWYTREVDYFSGWGLYKRAATDRKIPILQDFWKSIPHYAIWDDHDFGWNDGDASYPFKNDSRNAFKSYWANPSYGTKDDAIYSKFTWNDVDVFLLDDRWYRSNDNMKDSIDGKVNVEKQMFGKEQIQWLKNALLQSNANGNINFRIIATGSQVLNPVSPFDCFRRFPAEYNDFLDFLAENKINGVVFFTGDRHHSEIIKLDRKGAYPLFDITASPLTSGTHSFGGPEKDNPARVLGVDKLQNYARVSFTGKSSDRKLQVDFLGINGELINSWSISQKELKSPK